MSMASLSTSSSMETSSNALGINNSVTQTFPFTANLNPLTLHLDRTNYNFWRAQVLLSVRAHNLEGFLFGTIQPPAQFVDVFDPNGGQAMIRTLNPDYIIWNRQDQYLVSWLLSSMSESMLVMLHDVLELLRFGTH